MAMADCFCGCGRQISRFPLGIRTVNKRGRMVAERLAWARAYEEDAELFRDEFFADGDRLVTLFRIVLHQDFDDDDDDPVMFEWFGRPPALYLSTRARFALDVLERQSNAWMGLGRELERAGVEHGRTLPINAWLEAQP